MKKHFFLGITVALLSINTFCMADVWVKGITLPLSQNETLTIKKCPPCEGKDQYNPRDIRNIC